MADLQTQGKHDVNYVRYWVDEGQGKIFCLVEAPSAETAVAVHKEAHGLVPDDIFFAMLQKRVFPVGNFIRSADSLDYLEEPDCFHDIFGHVPMILGADGKKLSKRHGALGAESYRALAAEIVGRESEREGSGGGDGKEGSGESHRRSQRRAQGLLRARPR